MWESDVARRQVDTKQLGPGALLLGLAKSILVMLHNRQKIIKLADKSEFGWATVQEYVCDDLADDEIDASKIKKAEKRATV